MKTWELWLSSLVGGLALLAAVAAVPRIAHGAVIDDGPGVSIICGHYESCVSGRSIDFWIPVVGDYYLSGMYNGYPQCVVEPTAATNVEARDEQDNMIFVGEPAGIKLEYGQATWVNVTVPASATRWRIPSDQQAVVKVRVRVTGAQFKKGDSREYWINLNNPPPLPCSGDFCGGEKGIVEPPTPPLPPPPPPEVSG